MGCSSCAAAAAAAKKVIYNNPSVSNEPCNYTKEMLQIWLQKLNCTKEGGNFEAIASSLGEINMGLGVVESALKNENNICNFVKHLETVSSLIIKIANLGVC